jgi:hypothetical protein
VALPLGLERCPFSSPSCAGWHFVWAGAQNNNPEFGAIGGFCGALHQIHTKPTTPTTPTRTHVSLDVLLDLVCWRILLASVTSDDMPSGPWIILVEGGKGSSRFAFALLPALLRPAVRLFFSAFACRDYDQ